MVKSARNDARSDQCCRETDQRADGHAGDYDATDYLNSAICKDEKSVK